MQTSTIKPVRLILLLLGLLGSGRFESGLPTAESILPRGLFRMVTAERADECPFEHLGAC